MVSCDQIEFLRMSLKDPTTKADQIHKTQNFSVACAPEPALSIITQSDVQPSFVDHPRHIKPVHQAANRFWPLPTVLTGAGL